MQTPGNASMKRSPRYIFPEPPFSLCAPPWFWKKSTLKFIATGVSFCVLHGTMVTFIAIQAETIKSQGQANGRKFIRRAIIYLYYTVGSFCYCYLRNRCWGLLFRSALLGRSPYFCLRRHDYCVAPSQRPRAFPGTVTSSLPENRTDQAGLWLELEFLVEVV